jgi:hypothetical protein
MEPRSNPPSRITNERASNARDTGRNIRFAPERSQVISRQNRILHDTSIIEVPENMYAGGNAADLE